MFNRFRNTATSALSTLRTKAAALAVVASTGLVALPAAASGGGLDVSEVVSAIGAAATPIAAIGSAVLVVMVGIKVWKWVRRAM